MRHALSRGSIPRSFQVPFALAALSLVAWPVAGQRGGGGGGANTTAQPLRFQWVGPAPAGRIASVAGIPGDTSTYYFGAASGGIWKTTDGARTFASIFDDQPVQAIGALAVAPSNPRIVWAGTGEAWAIRDSDIMGDGIYKSTDAGATWRHMGLKETGRIGRILIHPTNPNPSLATLAAIEKDLAAAKLAYTKLMDTDVKAFNEVMQGRVKVVMER